MKLIHLYSCPSFPIPGATVVSWRVNNQEQLFVRYVRVTAADHASANVNSFRIFTEWSKSRAPKLPNQRLVIEALSKSGQADYAAAVVGGQIISGNA